MKNPKDKTEVDLIIGKRVRQRRLLMGLTQEKLGNLVGIKFQQIQKYESGSNRIAASRLWQLSEALQVPISFFFDDLDSTIENPSINNEMINSSESIKILKYYYSLDDASRSNLKEFLKSICQNDEE